MPIVRRRREAEKTNESDDRASEPARESIATSRARALSSMPSGTIRTGAAGAMREPLPTAEFSAEELAEALERLRAEDPSAVPPRRDVARDVGDVDREPRRTRSGERPIVRPPIAFPTSDDLAHEVRTALEPRAPEPSEPAPVSSPEPALAPVAPLAVAEVEVEVVDIDVEEPERAPSPLPAPLLPQVAPAPPRRGLRMLVMLVVLATIAAAIMLVTGHRF